MSLLAIPHFSNNIYHKNGGDVVIFKSGYFFKEISDHLLIQCFRYISMHKIECNNSLSKKKMYIIMWNSYLKKYIKYSKTKKYNLHKKKQRIIDTF